MESDTRLNRILVNILVPIRSKIADNRNMRQPYAMR